MAETRNTQMDKPTEKDGRGAPSGNILDATLGESNHKTPEVSTAEVRRLLATGSAMVLDTRKRVQYDAGQIPGAHNVDAHESGMVAEVDRLVGGDKTRALVLYCNGPFCKASNRLSDQLVGAGYTSVQRYQLGIPIWRGMGGPTQVELEGILRIYQVDPTAVFFDARPAADFAGKSLPGTHNVPADRLSVDGLDKAAVPEDDFNTRIVLFGRDADEARALAVAFSNRPWHNVSYFSGTFETLRTAIR